MHHQGLLVMECHQESKIHATFSLLFCVSDSASKQAKTKQGGSAKTREMRDELISDQPNLGLKICN